MASQKVTFNEVIYLDDIMYDLVDDECNFIFCDIQETCQISSKDAALKLGWLSYAPDILTNDFNYHKLSCSLEITSLDKHTTYVI